MQVKFLLFAICILFTAVFVFSNRVTLKRKRRTTGPQSADYAVVPLTHIPYVYYGTVTIGTPKDGEEEQVFTVLFDTGSPHLWVTSVGACSHKDCTVKTYKTYNGSKSSTYTKGDKPFEIKYLDETDVKGHLSQDTLRLGSGDKQLLIKDQYFGEATSITGVIIDSDGTFGLGFKLKNDMPGNPEPPFVSMARHLNIQPVVGFYLNKLFDEDSGGEIIFGGFDGQLIEGDFTFHHVATFYDDQWLPLPMNRFWLVNFDKITVVKDGEPKIIYLTNKILGLVDTGNNHISGPDVLFDKLNAFIFKDVTFQYNDKYSFPCKESWKDLPNVLFTMDGIDYPLKPEDYLWPDNLHINCRSGFLPTNKSTDITMGTLFIQKYYTVFDMQQKRVGFAKAKHQKHWKQKIGL